MASGIVSLYRTGATPDYVSFVSMWQSTPDAATNTSALTFTVTAHNNSGQFYVTGSATTTFTVGTNGTATGTVKTQTATLNISPGGTQTIYNQTFTCNHDVEGECSGLYSGSISGGITATGAGDFTLDKIQRGAMAMVALASKTETGATLNWFTGVPIDYFWYKIGNGNWVANGSVSGVSGAFTLTGLSANTTYSVKIKVRKASNQVITESDATTFTTYSYPYATNMPNFNIGSTLSVGLYNPLGRSVSVKLQDANGNQMGSQSTSGTAVSGYAGTSVVTALYGSIPNAKSGTYKIAVTYGGHTETRTGGKYYTVEANCKPALNAPTYADTSLATLVTLDDQIIVQNKSTPKVTVTGLASQKSASIASVTASIPGQTITLTVNGTTASGTFAASNSAVNMTCTVTVTDSRGYKTSKTVTMTVVAYYEPKVTLSVHRHNNYYSETDLKADVDFAAVGDNEITINYNAQVVDGTDTVRGTLTNHVTAVETMDNTQEWEVAVLVTDRFGSYVSVFAYLPKGVPIIFFDKDKYSVGINCFPEQIKTLEVDGAVLNRNVITATASGVQTSGTSSQKINVAQSAVVGDQLTIASGSVRIGAKLKNVLVSAIASTLSGTAGNHSVSIRKGSTAVATASRNISGSPYSDTIAIPPVLVSVAANDTISVYVSGFASSEYVGVVLTVEAMA